MTNHFTPTNHPANHHTNDLTESALGAGLLNLDAHWSHADRLCEEDFFVDGLRGYVCALASRSVRATPSEYASIVADLTDGDGEPSARRSTRLAHLLHRYATYIPAGGCQFLELGPTGYHGWISRHGPVVLEIVTTLAWRELSPADDRSLVEEALRHGVDLGDSFAGVRLIVLDAPSESSLYHPRAIGKPTHVVPLRPMDGAQ